MPEDPNLKQLLVEPASVDELQIPQGIIVDIMLRLLFNEGSVPLRRFIDVLKISNRILDSLLLWMQKEYLVEVSRASAELGRLGNVYVLTDAGKNRARDSFDRCQYVGPV